MGAKNGKRPGGIDLIQAEVCKNQIVIFVLHKLFNLCLKTGKVPSMWNRGIITPMPKCSTSDPRDPLSYRGIPLAPFAYKVVCGILNDRLVKWLDEREIIKDEQNGFMKGRSTVDHKINSLIDDINVLNIGIDIDNEKLAILLYADDVVLLADNEKVLQKMCLIFGVKIMLCMLMSISPKLCILETPRYHGQILILQ